MWKILFVVLILQLAYVYCDVVRGVKLLNSKEFMFNVTQQFIYELEDYGLCNTKLQDMVQNINREKYFGYNVIGTVIYKNGFLNTFQDVSLRQLPQEAAINQKLNSAEMKAELIFSSIMMFYDYYADLSEGKFSGTVAIPMKSLQMTIYVNKFFDNNTITHKVDITSIAGVGIVNTWYYEPANHYTEIINKDMKLNFTESEENLKKLWNKLLGKAIEKFTFPKMCFMCLT